MAIDLHFVNEDGRVMVLLLYFLSLGLKNYFPNISLAYRDWKNKI